MTPEIIVAGHVCLDIIPSFEAEEAGPRDVRLEPGRLIKVGAALFAPGGAVANTGIALHRLGIPVRLLGKLGPDAIGGATLAAIASVEPTLAAGMVVDPAVSSSYTIVISPPEKDRLFLHCPGANDHFGVRDLAGIPLTGARLLHFGYPTLMRSIYSDGGVEMAEILQRAKAAGLVTSLDMSMPDMQSEAGRVDWAAWLQRVLPLVDIFLPSLDETRLMLHLEGSPAELAALLRSWGAGIVGLKMGEQGLFVDWQGRTLSAPCFNVNVVGTTGAGDCTIAGFLAGYVKGLPPEEVMTMAVAVGACCCEAPDATSGIRPWEEIRARIAAGWQRRP